MNKNETIAEMTQILRDILGDDMIDLAPGTRREHVPNWDSFNYVTFMVAVEDRFGISFRAADMDSFADVGAIASEIARLRLGR